jgi:hypothetical protein
MYLCGSDGRVFTVAMLAHQLDVDYAPHRLGSIAGWCSNTRVAVALTRSGEILVFKDKKLQFAKRRGIWQYYPHETIIKRLAVGSSELRQAVYETCLDVSFARTGGCISILIASGLKKMDGILKEADLIENKECTRTKLLAAYLKKPFQHLDRRLRQELVSIDGATVLTRNGKLITAGAIVAVPGGSTSGGRKAAAMQLSKYGIGIKISADGPAIGFRDKKEVFKL